MKSETTMRYALPGLILMSAIATAAIAAPTPETFDEAAFEKRFKAADKDNQGSLTRAEAYAEFPRMPEFFDEIDANKDNAITLLEVQNAMERRVNAAMNASRIGSQYPGAAETKPGDASTAADAAQPSQPFSSQAEARRYHRYEYYESLAGSQEKATNRGALVPSDPMQPLPTAPMQIDKSF
jgi:hypothetical protein